jgi:enterochelin esterase-like enzyme
VPNGVEDRTIVQPVRRRTFFKLAGTLVAAPAAATVPQSADLHEHELHLEGEPALARRALLLVPRKPARAGKLPLLVLLHGLGETGNEALGLRAWADRYGLIRAYERLCHPPLARTLPTQPYLSDERLRELNGELARRPFGSLAIVCPVTPNPHRPGPASRTLDRYAAWLADVLLPAVRARVPIADGPNAIGLDGCSLGGYVGLEVFLRRPELFGTFGSVQGAFGLAGVPRYAERIAEVVARVGPRRIHLETSSQDPYRRPNQALARRLEGLGIPNTLLVGLGPHDQPWLREVGTVEMLLWQQRQLDEKASRL